MSPVASLFPFTSIEGIMDGRSTAGGFIPRGETMKRLGAFVALTALAVGGAWLTTIRAEPTKTAPDLEQLRKKATVNGKYGMLLAQIKVEDDKDAGEFKD